MVTKTIHESLVKMVVSDVLNERYGKSDETTDLTKEDIIEIVNESVNRVKTMIGD